MPTLHNFAVSVGLEAAGDILVYVHIICILNPFKISNATPRYFQYITTTKKMYGLKWIQNVVFRVGSVGGSAFIWRTT